MLSKHCCAEVGRYIRSLLAAADVSASVSRRVNKAQYYQVIDLSAAGPDFRDMGQGAAGTMERKGPNCTAFVAANSVNGRLLVWLPIEDVSLVKSRKPKQSGRDDK